MQVHVNDTGTRLVNNEGDVAVLVSPGFGAGWYTWNRDEVDPFDPQLAQFVFEGKTKEAKEYAEQKWPEAYHGGLEQLVQALGAEAAQQRLPRRNGARHRDGECRGVLECGDLPLLEPLDIRRRRRRLGPGR